MIIDPKRVFRLNSATTRPIHWFVADSESWRDAKNLAFMIIKEVEPEPTNEYVFFDKQSILNWMKEQTKNHSIYIYFHNLQWDMATIFDTIDIWKAKRIESGSKLIQMHYYPNGENSHKGKVVLRDSTALFPMPLSALGDALNLPKGTTPQKFIDGDDSQPITPEDLEYCRRDCAILERALLTLRTEYRRIIGVEGAGLPLTLAKMAFVVWSYMWRWGERLEVSKGKYYINSIVNSLFEKAYYGGRVESFFDGPNLDIYEFQPYVYYDINSMYPYVMSGEHVYPDFRYCGYLEKGNCTVDNLKYLMEIYFICAELVMHVDGASFEQLFLPYRNEDGLIEYHHDVFIGCLCQPEIELALELGWVIDEIGMVGKAIKCQPFNDYVGYFYEERKKLKAIGDGREFIYKRLMVSLYGKFGQKDRDIEVYGTKELAEIMKDKNYVDLWDIHYYGQNPDEFYLTSNNNSELTRRCNNQWFGFASAVTSYARCELHKEIIKQKDRIVYCDTDCVQLLGFEDAESIEEGKELGQWKLEGRGIGYWYDKKNYVHFTKDELTGNIIKTAKAKGITEYDGNPFKVQEYERPLKYREASRRTEGEFGEWIKTLKRCNKITAGLPEGTDPEYMMLLIEDELEKWGKDAS